MMRLFVIIVFLPLMSCTTASKPDAAAPLPVSVTTNAEAKDAGLTSNELAEIESFYDFVHSGCRTGQYRIDPSFTRELRSELRRIISKRFGKPSDPHFIIVDNGQHLLLGLAFSPSSHRLHVLDHSILPEHDYVQFARTTTGYDITYVGGCLVTPIKIVKNRGRPFIITIDRHD